MLKNENGITLIVLVITVVVIIILVSASIKYGGSSLGEVKLQNFSYQLQQIQGRVDAMYEKMKAQENSHYVIGNNMTLGQNITGDTEEKQEARNILKTLKQVDYASSEVSTSNAKYYATENYTIYRYFSREELEEQLDIKDAEFDAIINFKTREVISVQGLNYNEQMCYTLEDIKKLK